MVGNKSKDMPDYESGTHFRRTSGKPLAVPTRFLRTLLFLRMQMPLFLTGKSLTQAIKKVAGGHDLRCAVAFWGLGAAHFLEEAGADLSAARILCDLSMGVTSADALVELGAPTNKRLCRHDGLHAKVYISDVGMVVGSPNASANGLGFDDHSAGWLEAGSFHEPNTQAWRDAASWFNAVYRKAQRVDDEALAEARRKAREKPDAVRLPVREGSILDLVREHHEQFGPIGFVFTDTRSSKQERDKARDNLRQKFPAKKVDAMPDEGIFTHWSKEELNRWPTSFVSFFLSPRGKLWVSGRLVVFHEYKTGSIFSRASWPNISQQLPRNAPSPKSIIEQDAKIVAALLDRSQRGILFATPSKMSAALKELNNN
jgi:hypothetical protein